MGFSQACAQDHQPQRDETEYQRAYVHGVPTVLLALLEGLVLGSPRLVYAVEPADDEQAAQSVGVPHEASGGGEARNGTQDESKLSGHEILPLSRSQSDCTYCTDTEASAVTKELHFSEFPLQSWKYSTMIFNYLQATKNTSLGAYMVELGGRHREQIDADAPARASLRVVHVPVQLLRAPATANTASSPQTTATGPVPGVTAKMMARRAISPAIRPALFTCLSFQRWPDGQWDIFWRSRQGTTWMGFWQQQSLQQ